MANEPEVNKNQEVETNAYVPTYKIKPEFKQAVLNAIGDRPFNEIAGIMNAIDVEQMDHPTLTQVLNVLGQFPFIRVQPVMSRISELVEQEILE
jgi:hypothetical protein